MTDELNRRLAILAREVGRVKFSPTGSNLDEFCFKASCRVGTLTFKHGSIEVKVANFELIDAEEWARTEDYRYPARSGKFGIRYYYYRADVSWKAGEHGGKDRIALGFWQHWDRLLSALGTSRERDIINGLLRLIDRQAAGIYHTELLAPAKAEKRTYPEDHEARQRVF